MIYFVMGERFSPNDLFDPGLSLFQIRDRIIEITSLEVDEAQKVFLTLWQIFYLIMEMEDEEEKMKLLKTGKDLSRNLESYLWLLSGEKVETIVSTLEITKERVSSEKAVARSLMTGTILFVNDCIA
jgi:hypothetical protein